jgi:PTH2 family peptidyl-tRNA hydrolase
MEPKQIIVLRKDLKMRKGKMIAQGAHASMKVILDVMYDHKGEDCMKLLDMTESEPLYQWVNGLFTKVVVGCNSEEELLALKEKADEAGILNALIQDAGKTEFHGIKTHTALAIGPDWVDQIDKITGHLKLL